MNLLIINQHPPDTLGVSEKQCDLIARGLTERGHQGVYAAVRSRRKEEYRGLPYRVVPLGIEKRGELLRLLEEDRSDPINGVINTTFSKTFRNCCQFRT